jgi:hypothetical protein
MTIFECPRITFVRDAENGCISFYFGRLSVNVYGGDSTPELVEMTDREQARERLVEVVIESRRTG